jgi:hypothetical protein
MSAEGLGRTRLAAMGAWGIGPFDNDGAGDALAMLAHLPPPERADQIRDWLTLPDEDYLEVDTGQIVVAMAALLAAALGASTEQDAYLAALIADGCLPTDASTRQLAVAALARIAADDSEWQELWAEAGELTAVLAVNERLAEVLTAR